MTQRKIEGIEIKALREFTDSRGKFSEVFREDWFERSQKSVQANRSISQAGAIRGLHYHLKQTDIWFMITGRLFVALCDLRADSPSKFVVETFELDQAMSLLIPPGIAHGFQAMTDCAMVYLVDRYYDPNDEHGVAFNDPELGIDWPIGNPIVSDRDLTNPKLSEIEPVRLPS